jgi:hypothetical protein
MSGLRFLTGLLIAAMTAVASLIAFAPEGATARPDAPTPGDECTVLHATTEDANGRPMWCNPTMTGEHTLVWQYGGPAPTSQ